MSIGSLLAKLVGGPVKGLVDAVGGVIDKVTTTDEERLAAQKELLQIERTFNVAIAQVDAEFAAQQKDVIVAEAAGKSWLQRNWRPSIMLFFAVIIGTIVWTGGFVNGRELNHDFVMEILNIIKLGLSGYVVGRTVEKVAPSIVGVFKGKDK